MFLAARIIGVDYAEKHSEISGCPVSNFGHDGYEYFNKTLM